MCIEGVSHNDEKRRQNYPIVNPKTTNRKTYQCAISHISIASVFSVGRIHFFRFQKNIIYIKKFSSSKSHLAIVAFALPDENSYDQYTILREALFLKQLTRHERD